jgi:general secretion pathway protein L
VAASGAAFAFELTLSARHDELTRQIRERRAALASSIGPETAALRNLEQRKWRTPSSVIVLDVLSRILPDNTYVTELRIDGDTLQLTGITQDAPELIRLMEQAQQFRHATFFAPTTRAPGDSGDRFHIEARINPVFSPSS